MEKRKIGHSNLYASTIGLGCMSLDPNHIESEYIIHKAIDSGINYFDTADLYQFGKNEQLLGKALKGKRADVIIATKGGNEWNVTKDSWKWNPTKRYIKEAVKNSVTRLQTDYIDLYQLHGGTTSDPIDETIEAFEELISEGWIRYYGISSIRQNVIKEYVQKSNIVSVMMQYSLLDVRPEEEVFDLLAENNINVIARGPVAKGLLTDNYLNKFEGIEGYLNYSKTELENVVTELKQWAHSYGYTLHELALHYCLGNKAVSSVIPGCSTMKQLTANVSCIKQRSLTSIELIELRKIIKTNYYTSHR
ncbi:oxidoreductase [Anaerobacillus arseniciselenatis]|uniref:Oxidoreductase n=1 Tax=Anaerobacillus arseniciselenatis TaxID=85682 RepID=A0A1S2LUS8_9BACI|nr:aldo/keto reductase [Anaerobacillus arseniciselenatis]OIJ15950.1 oxidoreductase [Anaerobacillus arseniciselenatis]